MDTDEAAAFALHSTPTDSYETRSSDAGYQNGRSIAQPGELEESSNLQRHETSTSDEVITGSSNVISIDKSALDMVGGSTDGVPANVEKQAHSSTEQVPYADAADIDVNQRQETGLNPQQTTTDNQSLAVLGTYEVDQTAGIAIPKSETDSQVETDAHRPTKLDETGARNVVPDRVRHTNQARLVTDGRASKDRTAELARQESGSSTQQNVTLAHRIVRKFKLVFGR